MAIDTTTLSNLIDSIYAAGMGDRSWHAVAAEVATAFGEQGGVLYEFDSRLRQSRVLGSTPIDPGKLAEYEQYYAAIDDWHRRVVQEPTLEANATHNLIRDSDLERTEFCNDYLRQLDLFYAMGGVVRRKGGRTTVFGVQRSRRRGHFNDREFSAMEQLVRHVDRSLAIAERIERLRLANSQTPTHENGTVLLHKDGRIAFADEAVLGLLARAKVSVAASRLMAPAEFAAALDALISSATRAAVGEQAYGASLLLPAADGAGLRLTALSNARAVVADRGSALGCLLVERLPPPAQPGDLLRQRFRLTPSEATLALALAEGGSLDGIAAQRRVSVNTLRVQLQAIFAKTSCHRQSDLVRLVLRLPAT